MHKLEELEDIKVESNVDLTKLSTMRLVARGNLITVFTVVALGKLIKILNEESLPYQLLGLGANQLLPPTSQAYYIKLKFNFDKSYLDQVHENYCLPASVPLSVLSSHAIRNSIKGWECFTGIPATLGGAIFMNAGTNLGEIAQLVKEVKIMTCKGTQRIESINKDSFSYRKNNFLKPGEVIFEATLCHYGQDSETSELIKKYLNLRNESQPLKEWTCGCIFKNVQKLEETSRAGQYIDLLGLKGLEYNGIRVSQKHANFMENFNQASLSDMKKLIEFVQEELNMNFGLNFETEVKIPKHV